MDSGTSDRSLRNRDEKDPHRLWTDLGATSGSLRPQPVPTPIHMFCPHVPRTARAASCTAAVLLRTRPRPFGLGPSAPSHAARATHAARAARAARAAPEGRTRSDGARPRRVEPEQAGSLGSGNFDAGAARSGTFAPASAPTRKECSLTWSRNCPSDKRRTSPLDSHGTREHP